MIEAMTAYTNEIDDVKTAVSEITAQIGLGKLRGNSVGILVCHLDFITSGVVKALCASLPFDIAGVTSIASAVPGNRGLNVLSLLVLTSDDVFFSAALSGPMAAEIRGDPCGDVCRRALKGLPTQPEKCALGLTFMPFIPQWMAGDEILDALDKVSGGVPFFGTLAAGYSPAAEPPFVVFNGEAYTDRLAVVLMSGNVCPRFACVAISENKVSLRKGVVTDSEGNLLREIDGVPAAAYLEELGLADGGKLRWNLTIPVVVNYGDGTGPVSLIVVEQTPEGHIRMGGSVPVNSTFSVGAVDRGDILTGVSTLVESLKETPANAFFFCSCTLRALALKLDQTAELEQAVKLLDVHSTPYLFMYSGGEVAPLYTPDGRTVNRYHNVTVIGCAL
jgi:hypothetical protein